METIIIDLKKNSKNFIKSLTYCLDKDKDMLLKISRVCAEKNPKHIFSWSETKDAIKYLDNIKTKNTLCWFYHIYNICDKVLVNYNFKLTVKEEDELDALKAMKLFKKDCNK